MLASLSFRKLDLELPSSSTHSPCHFGRLPNSVEEVFSYEEISQKQLRKWDELQELVDAGLTSKSTIDSYIDKLDLAEGARLTFTKFKEFISYLDRALLDEDGDIFDDGTGLEGET